jgi:hypothetical protein
MFRGWSVREFPGMSSLPCPSMGRFPEAWWNFTRLSRQTDNKRVISKRRRRDNINLYLHSGGKKPALFHYQPVVA